MRKHNQIQTRLGHACCPTKKRNIFANFQHQLHQKDFNNFMSHKAFHCKSVVKLLKMFPSFACV